VKFGLDENDQFGVCGPTGCDNLCRALSAAALTGRSIAWTQDEVFALYKLNNPDFDPNTGAGDNGVDMQTMLELWQKHGAGHDENGKPIKPIAFAKVDVTNEAELNAAVALGGTLWGVLLQTSQQAQTDANPPRWDYKKSSQWGGHAIYHGEYDETSGIDHVISWEIDVQVTKPFRTKQLEEAWLVILPWHLQHPEFFNVVNTQALAAAYKSLTGKDLPVPSPPPPAPGPAPAPAPGPDPVPPAPVPVDPPQPHPTTDADDRELYGTVAAWAHARHVGANRKAAAAVLAWARAKGMEE
jgi:hypothetical protein